MTSCDDQGFASEHGLLPESASSNTAPSQTSRRSLKLGGLVALALVLAGSAVFLHKMGNAPSATGKVDRTMALAEDDDTDNQPAGGGHAGAGGDTGGAVGSGGTATAPVQPPPTPAPRGPTCGDHVCPVGMEKNHSIKSWDQTEPNDQKCCEACPAGYHQVGQKGDDIPGYGLSQIGSVAHSLTDCTNKCTGNPECGCVKFQWGSKACAFFNAQTCTTNQQTGHWDTVLTCRQADCQTIGKRGVGAGHMCRFPFVYNGVEYKTCTNVNHEEHEFWCATATTDNHMYVPGNWALCGDGCDGDPVAPSNANEPIPA